MLTTRYGNNKVCQQQGMVTARYVKKLPAVCYASLATLRILIATYELPNRDVMFVDHSRHEQCLNNQVLPLTYNISN